jgi:TetR/AcrR family transcriptional repressor of tetCD
MTQKTEPKKPRSLRDEHADATRRKIIANAHKSFVEKGFEGTSLDDIAENTRVTKGAIYHHFKNKRELFESCYEAQINRITQSVLSVGQDDNLWLDTIKKFDLFLTYVVDNAHDCIPLTLATTVLGYERWKELDCKYTMGIILESVENLLSEKLIKEYPPELLAESIHSLLVNAALQLVTSKNSDVDRRVVLSLIEDFLTGIKVGNDE